jgi:transposase
MKQLTAEHKHSILLHVQNRARGQTVDDIAALHNVEGGRNTIDSWRRRWNGTAQSLQRKAGAGRPRVLSSREVQQHVRAPILRANRTHRPIHYTNLLPAVQQKTGKHVSLRTLKRYGHDQVGARQTRGRKRTAEESEYTDTTEKGGALLPVVNDS